MSQEVPWAGYALKKGVDAAQELFVAFVKYKHKTPSEDGHIRRHVQLYGPDNKALYESKDKKGGRRRNESDVLHHRVFHFF